MFMLGGVDLNKPITSKEDIIKTCQAMVQENGISSINMRSVALKCQVSVGAVYNYFPSKTDLICATIESIWKDIFHMSNQTFIFTDFIECLTWLFESIKKGSMKYPEFLSKHAVSLASQNKVIGQKMMNHYFQHLKDQLLIVLKNDHHIREDAFHENLSETLFVEYIFELFISSIMNCHYDYQGILEIVKRYLY